MHSVKPELISSYPAIWIVDAMRTQQMLVVNPRIELFPLGGSMERNKTNRTVAP